MLDVWRLYQNLAVAFDHDRSWDLVERRHLYEMASLLLEKAHILDVGCSMDRSVAGYYLERGFSVTGVDAAPAITGWDSFCHLYANDQRAITICITRVRRRTNTEIVLANAGFNHRRHRKKDHAGGYHTVWLAQVAGLDRTPCNRR